MQIPLTPEQYQSALTGLEAYRGPDLKSVTVDKDVITIQTSQVDLTCLYNGIDSLNVVVTARYGLAKLASDSTIKAHLLDLLGKV